MKHRQPLDNAVSYMTSNFKCFEVLLGVQHAESYQRSLAVLSEYVAGFCWMVCHIEVFNLLFTCEFQYRLKALGKTTIRC